MRDEQLYLFLRELEDMELHSMAEWLREIIRHWEYDYVDLE